MKNDVLLYPSLNDYYLDRIKFSKRPCEFYYTDRNDEEYELLDEAVSEGSAVSCIKDPEGRWTQDDYNLCIRRKCRLSSFQCLFGPNGIVCSDARLGIGVQWTSPDSKQRGIISLGSFCREDSSCETMADHRFGKAQLRGDVTFATVLFIAQAVNPDENEQHLANIQGAVLGRLDSFTIKLDGIGSTFPIFEVPEPGQPLWHVMLNWQDPSTDLFSDTVSINLNTAHRNYKYIDRNQKTFDSQLLCEIMAGAITVIIERRRSENCLEDIVNDDSLEQGSVGQAINYFVNALGWDIENAEKVSLSARKFFDQRVQ